MGWIFLEISTERMELDIEATDSKDDREDLAVEEHAILDRPTMPEWLLQDLVLTHAIEHVLDDDPMRVDEVVPRLLEGEKISSFEGCEELGRLLRLIGLVTKGPFPTIKVDVVDDPIWHPRDCEVVDIGVDATRPPVGFTCTPVDTHLVLQTPAMVFSRIEELIEWPVSTIQVDRTELAIDGQIDEEKVALVVIQDARIV